MSYLAHIVLQKCLLEGRERNLALVFQEILELDKNKHLVKNLEEKK